MAREISLKYPATCADCGAGLPAGARARWYGKGRIYGVECHAGELPDPEPVTQGRSLDLRTNDLPGCRRILRRTGYRKATAYVSPYSPGEWTSIGWNGGSCNEWSYVDRAGKLHALGLIRPDEPPQGDPWGQARILPDMPADAVAVLCLNRGTGFASLHVPRRPEGGA